MKTAAISVRVAPALKDRLQMQADAEGRSLANHVERTLRRTHMERCFICGKDHIDPNVPGTYRCASGLDNATRWVCYAHALIVEGSGD